MKVTEVKADLKALEESFADNELVLFNLPSIIADFEFMHHEAEFEDTLTPEEATNAKTSQLATFICGVLAASSPQSAFRENLQLPTVEKEKQNAQQSQSFADSLKL